MSTEIFSSMLVDALGNKRGLAYLSMPASMTNEVMANLVAKANERHGTQDYAFLVSSRGDNDFGPSISPEMAISLRSMEDGGPADVLIVARDGEFKELASLQAFRHLNPMSVPAGIAGIIEGELRLEGLVSSLIQLVEGQVASAGSAPLTQHDLSELKDSTTRVLVFLGNAYLASGNHDLGWKDAWWRHLWNLAERLPMLVERLRDDKTSRDCTWQAAAAYAAAGLPIPDGSGGNGYLEKHHGPAVFATRIAERWLPDGDSASIAAMDIERNAKDAKRLAVEVPHPINELPWAAEFDSFLAIVGHPILAVSMLGHQGHGHVDAWLGTTEKDFFEDRYADIEASLWRQYDEAAEEAPALAFLKEKHYVLTNPIDGMAAGGNSLDLGTYQVRLGIGHGQLAISDFTASARPGSLEVSVGGVHPTGDGMTSVELSLKLRLPSSGKGRWREKPFTLVIEPVVHQGRPVPFSRPVRLQLLLPLPGHSTFYLSPITSGKKARKLIELDPRAYEFSRETCELTLDPSADDDSERGGITLGDASSADVFIAGPRDELFIGDVPQDQVDVGPAGCGLVRAVTPVPLENDTVIRHGEAGLVIKVEERDERPISPIVAAARGTRPGTQEDGQQKQAWLEDPRGFLEENWLSSYYAATPGNKEGLRNGLAQAVMLVNDREQAKVEPKHDPASGFHVLGNPSSIPHLPEAIRSGKHVEEFWHAFDALGLASIQRESAGLTSSWPSRLRLVDIDKQTILGYLEAYAGLVRMAKEDESDSLKWLLYPFTVFLFDPARGTFKGMLLSPLHPLRLAWNWSVQHAAAEAWDALSSRDIDVEQLLRFVDGSALPHCGPLPMEPGFAATLPLEPGAEELFVTWSYLGNVVDINAETPPPATISGFKFPAGAPSGLDRGGVAAAINDYLRVYPYASELRLGLDSLRVASRSRELDRAIVSELDSLLKQRAARLPGGIKVLDSKRRTGALPAKDKILARVFGAMDVLDMDDENKLWRLPFEWKNGQDEQVDIRFLEDSLSRTKVVQGAGTQPATGVIPRYPVTRLHAWVNIHHGGQRRSGFVPHLGNLGNSELETFPPLLNELEQWNGERLEHWFHVPPGSHLQGTNANWIVSGNSNLDPRLLSEALVASPEGNKVLWEWRPPYLPRRWKGAGSTAMQSHPYTVIASLPQVFKTEVNAELENVLGGGGDITALLRELGTRGVGMASLLAMGHQQSRGAIGFYLGFRLARCWEQAAEPGEVRIVLPLDAVNPVFAALVPESYADDRKKADLLFISVRENGNERLDVTFIPVEIKMHAANMAKHSFPASDSTVVKDALRQLRTSTRLLEGFVETIARGKNLALLDAMLASLMSTGLALGSRDGLDPAAQGRLLAAVAGGHCDYKAGQGILFWFERAGTGHDNKPYLVRGATSVDSVTKVYVDPAACHVEIFGCNEYGLVEEFLRKLPGQSLEMDVPDTNLGGRVTEHHEEAPDSIQMDAGSHAARPPELPVAPTPMAPPSPGWKLEKLSAEDLEKRYDLIIDTLELHGVSVYKPGDIEHFTEGPASIMFRVRPAPAVDPQKISQKEPVLKLALGLSVEQSIRTFIHEGAVVIDVPKRQDERYFVDARQLWAAWNRPQAALAAPLGIDQNKKVVEFSFSSANSPHLLIGGTTGSGKSEALNTILFGLTRHYSSRELRLLLVDPKGTEMTAFEGSPHLEGDIGWDDESAIEHLDRAVNEMQRRYELFRAARKRSLPEYNAGLDEPDKLPWWLVVLDEYADLTSDPEKKKQIESLMQRLAQKARAAGIHVIIATQKPTVNVISTVLRANLPAQLALKVKSANESRVIMDEPGAEALNGMGDAFLKAEGKLQRLQCAIYKPA